MNDLARWEKRFARERAARRQAEACLEDRSRSLYELNQALEQAKSSLEHRVQQRTQALEQAVTSLRLEADKRRQIEAELRQARDAALQVADLKTEFLARMSHEIRTPLNAILGLTNLLLDSPLDEQQKDSLGTVRSSGEILLRIINDILDMSKIDAGRLDLEFAPTDVNTLIKQSFALVLLDAQSKGLEIIQRSQAILPDALVLDSGRLQQIITNLLSNAVKYSDTGAITVSLQVSSIDDSDAPADIARDNPDAAGHWQVLEVSVADEGRGIPRDSLNELFEPFTRVDDSSDNNLAGSSGLGLAICKRLCDLMGGDISVTSKLGHGSTFTVRVPCWLAGAPPSSSDDEEPIETTNISAMHQSQDHLLTSAGDRERMQQYLNMAQDKPLSILLADDYDVNRMVLLSQLKSLGYRADAVADGEEVLRALFARPYDVVLMDIRMPVIDGVETTKRIRNRPDGPQPHIIAVTASALKGDEESYLAAGMDAFVAKPVEILKLAEALEAAYEEIHGGDRAPWSGDLVDMNPVQIQLQELRERLGPGLNGLLASVIPVYLRELPGRLDNLENALAEGNAELFAQYCHGLKGTSLSIGAQELAEQCAGFESLGYEGKLPDSSQFSEFRDLALRTAKALKRVLLEQDAH